MAVRTITTMLALTGEAEYRAKIKNLNADLSLHKSELEKIQAEYKDSANSMTALGSKYSVMESQLSTLNEKHKEQADMLKKAEDAYDKYVKEVAALKEQQEALKNSSSASAEEEKKLAEQIAKAEENMQRAANSVTFYQKELNRTERDQANLSAELERTKTYLDEASNSADGCATSIDQFGKEVKQAAEETEEFSEKARIGVEQLAAALAAAGIAKGAKEIAEELWNCSVAAEGFEKTVAKINTIADTSSVSLDDIRAKVIELSGDSGKAASSISEAVYQAISSGAATSKAAGTVEKANKLAVGGFTSVETSVDVLTTALNAYKLQATETVKISDILITTQKKGKTSVDELAQSVGKVIPLAAAYNVQMDNLGTVYAVLTANGIATAEATTYAKSMLKELGDSGSKVAGILKEKTGKSFAELSKEGRSVGDVLAVLGDSVGDSSTAFNELWSSTEAGVGALSLFNSGADRFNSVLEEMQNSAGATEAAYRKMANTTEFAHQRMVNASDNLRIVIGEQLNPALKDLYNSGADAFIWATDFVEQNPWIVGEISAVTAGIGTLTVGLTLAANASTVAATAQAALNAVMSANPAFLVAAGVTALVAAVTAYSLTTGSADNETKELTKSMKESKEAYEGLKDTLKEEASTVSTSVKALKELLETENKSAAQKEALAKMVDQLNEAVPDLCLAYDAAADSINMTGDALERMTRNLADQDEHNAQVERLSELYTEQQSITDQLAETQERLDKALADAQWDSFGGAMNDAATQVSVLQGNMDSLTSAYDECAAEIAELEEATESFSQQQADAIVPTQEMEDRIAALCGQLTEVEAAYWESYSAAMDSINGQIGLFQEMDGTAKTSIDSLIGTLQGQVAYMETYAENINKAMEMGVDMGLVKKLSDGKEESAQILAAIVQGGEEDIKALNEEFAKVEEGKTALGGTMAEMEENFKEKMEAMVDDLRIAFDEMDVKDEAYEIGLNNIQGLIDGSSSPEQVRKLVNAYTELGKSAFAAYQKEMDQHSPSKKMFKAGTYDIQGLIQGAESEKSHLKSAYIDLAETGTLGVAEGLASSGGKVVKEADKLASEVYNRNKTWLDKQTKYQKLTLREQLEVWEAIQSQFVKESKQYADAEEKIFDLKAKMQDEYLKKVEEVNKKITDLEKKYQDTLANRTKEIFNSYKLFDKAHDLEEVSGRELIGNLQSQIKRMEDFYAGLRELSARGVGDALVEEIRAMGPSAMAQLDALLELSDLKLTEFADLYRRKQRLANYQAMEELQPLREETNRQIQESLNEMSSVYSQLAPAVGTAFTDAVAAGITSGSSAMTGAADAAAREAVAAAEQAMTGTVKTIGGISYDLNVDYSALMAAAKSYEEFSTLAAQRNAKIIGENIDLVGKGFSDNSQLLAKWQENFARAEEESNKAIASMAEGISGEIQAVGSLVQEMRSCVEAESQLIQKQIEQSVSQLAEKMAAEFQADRDYIPQAVSNAVRDALSGMAVNLNQRKVGEMITTWQNNNDRGWGA